jgi:hypothetical protein
MTQVIEAVDNLRSERVVAVLHKQQHSYFVSLELLIRDDRDLLKEDLSILSGFQVPDGDYDLHYDWMDKPCEKRVRVAGGRLQVLVPA